MFSFISAGNQRRRRAADENISCDDIFENVKYEIEVVVTEEG